MGKDAIKGKKKKPSVTQPTLPGMGSVKRVKPAKPETPVEAPAQVKKKTGLGEEIKQGYLPMFMTPGEMINHFTLADAAAGPSKTAEGKSDLVKQKEKSMMARKLRESKTGSVYNSHRRALPGVPTLHQSIAENGFDHTTSFIKVNSQGARVPRYGGPLDNTFLPEVVDGHHRLAALRNLNPNQFIPVRYR
jgi:uncharacterized protein YdhG (YjbR/CyaY superfamily)